MRRDIPLYWRKKATERNDYIYESFYKNEGIWEEKKQKINTAYFESFSFQTQL